MSWTSGLIICIVGIIIAVSNTSPSSYESQTTNNAAIESKSTQITEKEPIATTEKLTDSGSVTNDLERNTNSNNTVIDEQAGVSTTDKNKNEKDINKAQAGFKKWALENTAVTDVHYETDSIVWITLTDDKYTTQENVKEIAKFLARGYCAQTGVKLATVTVWQGNQIYAKGNSWD